MDRVLVGGDKGSRAILVNFRDISALISGFARIVLAIEYSGSSTFVQCLQGSCTFTGVDEVAAVLQPVRGIAWVGRRGKRSCAAAGANSQQLE